MLSKRLLWVKADWLGSLTQALVLLCSREQEPTGVDVWTYLASDRNYFGRQVNFGVSGVLDTSNSVIPYIESI